MGVTRMNEPQTPQPDRAPWLDGLIRLPAVIGMALRHLGQGLLRAKQRGQGWWRARSAFQQHLLVGLLAGVIVEIALHVMHHHLAWLREIEDMAIDGIMTLQQATPINNPAVPFVILDIDEPVTPPTIEQNCPSSFHRASNARV